jgi:hypothetical protein
MGDPTSPWFANVLAFAAAASLQQVLLCAEKRVHATTVWSAE